MAGARAALLVVNSTYDDAGLRQLRAPGADAAALAEVLADGSVGAFDVRILTDQPCQAVRTAIEEFFVDRAPDDLLLLHFSCHGVKSADGRLFLAQRDTRPKLLGSTGVPAEFVNEQMAASRAQRIALFLDCCYGGAFPRGLVGRSGDDAHIGDSFRHIEDESSGRGRVVVTASSAMQYAFEAGSLATEEVKPSLFTGALVEALSTGEADRDGDGWVGLTELFTFVRNKVRRAAPDQTPQMWAYGASGEILLARSRRRRIVAAEVDPEVVSALQSPLPSTRLGQVDLLREWMLGPDLSTALAAWQLLDTLTRDDSVKVRAAVARVRAEGTLQVTPQTLQLTAGGAETVLTLSGPPLARAITVTADSPALRMEYDEHQVRVATTAAAGDAHQALLTVTSPTGSVDVTVVVTESTEEDSPSVVVDVAPAPAPTPVAEDTALVAPIPADGRGRRRGALPVIASAVAVVVLGAVAWGLARGSNGDDDGGGGGGPTEVAPLSRRTLVWVESSAKENAIVAGEPNGPQRSIVPASERRLIYPSISPDRRTVVFLDVSAGGELFLVNSDGTGERRLDADPSCPRQGRPSWSPDGTQIATVCFGPEGRSGVAAISLDGEVEPLVDDPEAMSPDWSPTGKQVVYARSASGQDVSVPSTLWTVSTEGGAPEQLTDGSRDTHPEVDPTGQWAAFTRIEAGVGSLYKVNLRSHEVLSLTSPAQGMDAEPAWSPDGTTVVFQRGQAIAAISATEKELPTTLLQPTGTTTFHMAAWSSGPRPSGDEG